jgi:hypothetical protein
MGLDRNNKTDEMIQEQQNMQVLTGSTGQMGLDRAKGMDEIMHEYRKNKIKQRHRGFGEV